MSKDSRAGYYEKAFRDLEEFNVNTWNWAAFFFGIVWMLYRKMYLHAVIAGCTFTSCIFVLDATGMKKCSIDAISLLLVIAFQLYLGACGNLLYYDTVKAKIHKGIIY